MAKSLKITCKITAEEADVPYKASWPSSGSAGGSRFANSLAQSAGIVLVAAGGMEAIPLGDVSGPLVLGFRRLSGDAEVQVGLLIGGTFYPFAGLWGTEGGAIPLPSSLGSTTLYVKNLGAAAAGLEFFIS